MTIQDSLHQTLEMLAKSDLPVTQEQLISLIDYTCLKLDASAEDIQSLYTKASELNVAAICIYPQHLDIVPRQLPIIRATVVNFPAGDEPLTHVLEEMERIKHEHLIHEIDYVFPYRAYLSGNPSKALSHCKTVAQHCKQLDLTFKVILETGAFSLLNMVYDLSLAVIQTGCDFLKTSTGKISQGASIPAAYAMLSAIQDSQVMCGLKLSGGIKTIEQARTYIQLAEFMLKKAPDASWLRLGTSSIPAS